MSIINTVTNWNKAQETAKLIREVRREYVGCEVLEKGTRSETNYAVAVITHMRWENSMSNWLVGIRYLSDGSQTWVGCHALVLTGEKYNDIDVVVKLNPTFESLWS